MGDNQNSINRFPFKAFVLIHFADSICDVFYSGRDTSSDFPSFQCVNTILIIEAVFIVLVYQKATAGLLSIFRNLTQHTF